ncbi:uroporphyrinogen-III synthase [Ningiella sp. W23]|uniref:uroporphyrinogen-III synthase n=1 Tax=Ningiella sp. W23 TaxID=3023715 RepID=UPI0037571D93
MTRPQPKANETHAAMTEAGLASMVCCVIEIEPIDTASTQIPIVYDLIIVTSTFTEHFLHQHLSDLVNQCSRIICVGEGSASLVAKMLVEKGLNASLSTAEPQNSEGIIQSSVFADLSTTSSVALVKGRGGRGLIEQHLLTKGCKVDIFEAYQRVSALNSAIITNIEREPIACIIISSVEIAQNIAASFTSQWLHSRYFMVTSERIYDYLHSLGFKNIVKSESASTLSIVNCAKQLTRSGVLDDRR